METTSVRQQFSPSSLLAALALILAAVGCLSEAWTEGRVPLKLLLLGALLLVLGVALLFKLWSPACTNCRKSLERYEQSFAAPRDRDRLEDALRAGSAEQVLAAIEQAPVAAATTPGAVRFTLFVEACDGCQQVARLRLLQTTYDAKNVQREGTTIVPWTTISSPTIARVLALSRERDVRAQLG